MLPREDQNYDKLFKVQPLLNAVSTTIRQEYRPSKFLSVDEGMVKYKGRHGFKQNASEKCETRNKNLGPCRFNNNAVPLTVYVVSCNWCFDVQGIRANHFSPFDINM